MLCYLLSVACYKLQMSDPSSVCNGADAARLGSISGIYKQLYPLYYSALTLRFKSYSVFSHMYRLAVQTITQTSLHMWWKSVVGITVDETLCPSSRTFSITCIAHTVLGLNILIGA